MVVSMGFEKVGLGPPHLFKRNVVSLEPTSVIAKCLSNGVVQSVIQARKLEVWTI